MTIVCVFELEWRWYKKRVIFCTQTTTTLELCWGLFRSFHNEACVISWLVMIYVVYNLYSIYFIDVYPVYPLLAILIKSTLKNDPYLRSEGTIEIMRVLELISKVEFVVHIKLASLRSASLLAQ